MSKVYNIDLVVLMFENVGKLREIEQNYPLSRSYLKDKYKDENMSVSKIAEQNPEITSSEIETMLKKYHIYKSTEKYLSECDPQRAKKVLREQAKRVQKEQNKI